MRHTAWFLSDLDTSNLTTCYAYEGGVHYPIPYVSHPGYPSCLLKSTSLDLSRFLMAYMNEGSFNGQRILKEGTIKKVFTPPYKSDERQGLCWHTWKQRNGELWWGHSGGDPGVGTLMFFRPADRTGVIVFNNTGHNANEVLKFLFRTASDKGDLIEHR